MNENPLMYSRLGKCSAAVSVVLICGIVIASCTVPPQNPDGTVPQVPPRSFQGLFESTSHPGTIWGADLFGEQLIRFDPDNGRIEARFGGLCPNDDVVEAPDGSLITTCPALGDVVRVGPDGTSEQLAHVGNDVNPIALEPGGESVIVGFGTDVDDRLLRVPLDGGPVEVVASGLPPLNGFGFGPDGFLYAPTGGFMTMLTGIGGIAKIDLQNGTFVQLPLTFADGSTGLRFPSGVEVAPDGTIFVVQPLPPALFSVDPSTSAVSLVESLPLTFVDNLVIMSDGRIVTSGFTGNQVAVLTPAGGGTWVTRVLGIGA